MKYVVLTLIFMTSSTFADVKVSKRSNDLMNLLHQEMKILQNASNKGPELNYRMLELMSEKLKLVHEKNNLEFLEKSKTTSVSGMKESYFGETREYYAKTKEYGLKILKDFPNNRRIADIKFALAINSRDYGKDQITEKYLLETINLLSDPFHPLRHHAETALADYYYNEKKYKEAITYYERAIKKTKDAWKTKHLYNLSWCYLKVRDFDRAINTIKESYFESKKKEYVNIKDQVLENIGPFYVYAGRPLEGLDFYLKNETDPVSYIIALSYKASDKGHQKETEVILNAGQNLINKNNWIQYQEELYHAELDFYRHYNRFSDHEKTSSNLVKYYGLVAENAKNPSYKKEKIEDSIEKMRSTAGFLQVKLIKDMKQDQGNFEENELKLVLNYFLHLIVLDMKRKVEYLYFRAETYYSIRKFKESAAHYVETINEAKLIKNEEFSRKALNSLLALTALEVLPKEENKRYLTLAYTEHITLWPIDEKSEKIYPKLFEIYRDSLDDENATGVLRLFNKSYPHQFAEQQTLMTKVLDQFIDKKQTNKLAFWIHEFKSGFLKFSDEMIEKTEITLGNMLFMEYQEISKKGNKLAAAKGFESIYENKLYTSKIKSQSAFFASVSYLDSSETKKSYDWLVDGFKMMSNEDKASHKEDVIKMIERMYLLQDFKTSHKASDYYLSEYCDQKGKLTNRAFEISFMTSLVEDEPYDAYEVIKSREKCLDNPEIAFKAKEQLYAYYERRSMLSDLKKFVVSESVKDKTWSEHYFTTLKRWYWDRTDNSFKEDVLDEIKAINSENAQRIAQEINLFKKSQKELQEILKHEIWNEKIFDGDKFNASLESYLQRIQKFKLDYQALSSSSQFDLALVSTKLFVDFYMLAGEKVAALNPQGLDPAIAKDFKGAMKDVASGLFKASKQYQLGLDKVVRNKEKMNIGSRAAGTLLNIENPIVSSLTSLTMDKGKE